MSLKQVLIWIVALAAIAVGYLTLTHPSAPQAGSITGPESASTYQKVNGVTTYYNRQTMRTASATLCSIKSPAATTTLSSFVASFAVSSTSASTVYLAKAATATATTTNFETAAVAAGAKATIVASTTGRSNGLPVIAPNTYLVVGFNPAGGVGANTAPVGSCTAVLQGV